MILSGILLTPTGVPYSNSLVRITANNTNPDVLQFVSKDFRTTVDGEYEIDVPNGWYSVSVFVNSYHSFISIGNIEITDETTETTINALLMIGQTAGSDPLVAQVAEDAASALASKNATAASATNAATSASSAAVSATNAQNSATASANSATASQTSATNSQASATASASSASSASTSATIATTKASEAASSAQDALNSANNAEASAVYTESLLSTKENTITEGTSSQYWRGDKTFQTLDKSAVGLPNIDNTADISKPVSTAQQTALDAKTDKSVSLLSWAYSSSFQLVSATRDANEAIVTANIVWPDGVSGVFTTDVASTAFPGAIDAWHATYLSTPVKTVTQPTVTRDGNGAVIIQPAIIIS